MNFIDFLIGPFLIWLPKIFTAAVFLTAVVLYVYRGKFGKDQKIKKFYNRIAISSALFKIVYAIFLMIAQYYVWSSSQFTKIFVSSSLKQIISSIAGLKENICSTLLPAKVLVGNHGFFLFYSCGRFWIDVLISISAASIFYLFLVFLKKYRERFFETGEVELGFVLALIAGWPNVTLFIPLAFVFVVLVSIFRRVFLKEFYTTLGWPFILAASVVLLFGDKLINILRLGLLRI